jgi:hypothetical protein
MIKEAPTEPFFIFLFHWLQTRGSYGAVSVHVSFLQTLGCGGVCDFHFFTTDTRHDGAVAVDIPFYRHEAPMEPCTVHISFLQTRGSDGAVCVHVSFLQTRGSDGAVAVDIPFYRHEAPMEPLRLTFLSTDTRLLRSR